MDAPLWLRAWGYTAAQVQAAQAAWLAHAGEAATSCEVAMIMGLAGGRSAHLRSVRTLPDGMLLETTLRLPPPAAAGGIGSLAPSVAAGGPLLCDPAPTGREIGGNSPPLLIRED
jgi:hypothetical protein